MKKIDYNGAKEVKIMIPFSEKLSFLMHISNISNKALAAELNVDPSMVSLMRTGKRKLPRNPLLARKMALFFARNCSAAFQRQALSEALDQRSISASMPTEVLAARLESWLKGENGNIADAILTNIQAPPTPRDDGNYPAPVPSAAPQCETQFFYGQDGRRAAMPHMIEQLRKLEQPCPILIVVDDNLEWLLSDYMLNRNVQRIFLDLAERGFTFYQIMPPLNYINRYVDSLQFWLPLYVTGQTKVYFFPRLRGNLYRHSTILVPNRCVQHAYTVGLGSDSDISVFSTDAQLVHAFELQFQEHLALCKPSLNVRREIEECVSCYTQFSNQPGDIVQLIDGLSIESMPRELIERCMMDTTNPEWARTFSAYRDGLPRFEEHLRQYAYINMGRLATAEDVRAGRAFMGLLDRSPSQKMYYTPESYVQHLRNILRLMDQYENYTFLPLRDKEPSNCSIFVNEANIALVVRTALPPLMLEIQRPSMVTAFRENLLRKAESVGCDSSSRQRTRMELRALIQELED